MRCLSVLFESETITELLATASPHIYLAISTAAGLTLFWAGRGKFAPPTGFFLNKCQTTKGLDLESPDFE